MSLRIKKILFFVIIAFNANAQNAPTFSMGFIGNLGATDAFNSSFIYISGANCLDIETGLRYLLKRGNREFSIGCIERQDQELVELTSFPNPAIDFTVVKPQTPIPQTAENQYFIQVSDIRGRVYETLKTDFSGLTNGVRISLSKLPKGYYLINITSRTELFQALRIIKN